jgi:hypothetical protein
MRHGAQSVAVARRKTIESSRKLPLVIDVLGMDTETQALAPMATKHLIVAVARRFESMSRPDRIGKIKKLVAASAEDKKFIRQTFPGLYREAYSTKKAATGSHVRAAGRRARP